jgi:hypothetical protein
MADQPEERWVTYREAGQLLGISANAVRVRAQRARWPRRLPNMPGAPTLVRVPEEVRVRPGAPSVPRLSGERAGHAPTGPDGPEQAPERGLVQALDTLRQQLEIANRQTEAERARVDQLLVALADARTAVMISGCEAAALRARLELMTERRPWWRRWFR